MCPCIYILLCTAFIFVSMCILCVCVYDSQHILDFKRTVVSVLHQGYMYILVPQKPLEIKGTASRVCALRLLTTNHRSVWSSIHSCGLYLVFTSSVWLTQHFPPGILWYKLVTLHPLGGLVIHYLWLHHS